MGKFSRSGGKCRILPREICQIVSLSEVRASTKEIGGRQKSAEGIVLGEKKTGEGLNFLTKEQSSR